MFRCRRSLSFARCATRGRCLRNRSKPCGRSFWKMCWPAAFPRKSRTPDGGIGRDIAGSSSMWMAREKRCGHGRSLRRRIGQLPRARASPRRAWLHRTHPGRRCSHAHDGLPDADPSVGGQRWPLGQGTGSRGRAPGEGHHPGVRHSPPLSS
jgi:hypothetical protein